jgi:hydroxyacylglutathione hydrolase
MITSIIPILCNEKNMANYAYLVQPQNSTNVIIIDAAEANPIINTLEKLNLNPTHILTTHHHFDHVEGNIKLKEKYNLKIIAPEYEFEKVPGADIKAQENTTINIENIKFQPILSQGHTNGHMMYYIQDDDALFTGDVLFNLCVGGLFEGTRTQMFETLNKIKTLPKKTKIYPGHEYTRSAIEEYMLQHKDFDKYLQKMYQREQGLLSPSSLEEELLYNPYLRG